jgi:hypothetical protein
MLYENLFDNDATVTEVAPSELLYDCPIHCAVYIATAYELVPALFRWCKKKRDDCTKNDTTYIANLD